MTAVREREDTEKTKQCYPPGPASQLHEFQTLNSVAVGSLALVAKAERVAGGVGVHGAAAALRR
jgi:hypothetical protein